MDGLRRRRVEEDDVDAPLLGDESRDAEPSSPRFVPPSLAEQPLMAYAAQPSIYDMIMRVVSAFLDSFTSWFSSSPSEPEFVIDDEIKAKMEEFKKYATQQFDGADPTHKDTLKALWRFAFGDAEYPPSSVSHEWKKLGFQSDDPQRDFRATGIFGLKNILFFAEKYPRSFRRFANLDDDRMFEVYPFAITCFNLTMMVMELLGWGWKTKTSTAKLPTTYTKSVRIIFDKHHSREATENAFCELVCLALYLLDKTWVDAKASYMQFPNILAQTQDALEHELSQCTSLAEVLEKNSSRLS